MNDSWEFQEVESNQCGRFAYVPSQTAAITSSCSMLNRDRRLPLDTWNTSGLQENVFGNHFLQLIHPEIIIKEVTKQRHQVIQGRFQCIHLQGGRRPQVHDFRWIFCRILWLDSKDSRYRNCNSINSNTFYISIL